MMGREPNEDRLAAPELGLARKRWSAPRVIVTELRSAEGGSTNLTPDHKVTGTTTIGSGS